MTRGRPPLGPKIVERLNAPAQTKRRLEVLLETLAGQCSVVEACQKLGISQARLHEIRSVMLQAALESLEPRPAGRLSALADPSAQHVAALEHENRDLRIQLHAAQLREEIALAMPHLLQQPDTARKKTPPPTVRPTANPASPPAPSNDRNCDT